MSQAHLSEAGKELLNRIGYPNSLPRDFGQHEIIETHVSVVLLGSSKVLKFKKAVNLGFVDHTSFPARWRSAAKEVILNRRLSTHIYLGLYPFEEDMTRTINNSLIGTKIQSDCQPNRPPHRVVEVAVVMNRIDEQQMLSRMISNKTDVQKKLAAVALKLAKFHQQQRTSEVDPSFGDTEHIGKACFDNIREVRNRLASTLNDDSQNALTEIQQFTNEFLKTNAPLFSKRNANNWVIDGHGDLRAEHICFLNDAPAVIDCVEFSDELRTVDVLSDTAFLTTDFEHQRRADLATIFEKAYFSSGEIEFNAELYRFYKTYRAMVRAKVSAIRAGELLKVGDSSNANDATQKAERYISLASRHALNVPSPSILLIGGLMGIGKSTLANAYAHLSDAQILSTDKIRKDVFGSQQEDRSLGFKEGKYSEEASERVYRVMAIEAKKLLAHGNPVVLDASFIKKSHRQFLKSTLDELSLPHSFAWCELDKEETFKRLSKRARDASAISDGRIELYEEQKLACELPEPTEGMNLLHLDLSLPTLENVKKLISALQDAR